jgi:hypothetical protein
MEKVWRIVYSAVFFCSFKPLSPQVLLTVREGVELQPHAWRAQPWLQTRSDLGILS